MSIRKGTTIIAGNSSPLDWTGTLEEYNIALENGTIKPNMVCYVTDDTLYTDDIRPEIETLNNIKANKDLSNLSEVGEKHFLNKSQITNCILEVPQRIKYTLVDGTLTLLKGSVVIVPYGLEDKTGEFPVGSVFINDNFKVYDTQYADGKFFVWVELPNDMSFSRVTTDSNQRFIVIYLDKNTLEGAVVSATTSGSTLPTTGLFYNTTDNTIKYYSNSSVVNAVTCLPFGLCTANGANIFGTVDQVFNGMGYIGSTIWVDKGVKGLIPNGRNEDGTLKNYEITTPSLFIRSYNSDSVSHYMYLSKNGIGNQRNDIYDEQTNINWNGDNTQFHHVLVGTFEANGGINNFQPKLPFRAVDYSDSSTVSGWSMPSNKRIDLTLGASETTYTAPANGWLTVDIVATALRVDTSKKMFGGSASDKGSINTRWSIELCKGDTFTVRYSAVSTVGTFAFVYAQGEV